MIFIP